MLVSHYGKKIYLCHVKKMSYRVNSEDLDQSRC